MVRLDFPVQNGTAYEDDGAMHSMKMKTREIARLFEAAFVKWNEKDPFRESAVIAYYAIFALPDGCTAMMIADVSGHGVTAALISDIEGRDMMVDRYVELLNVAPHPRPVSGV